MITNASFRRLEQMLTAASLPSDTMCTLIALAIETMSSDPETDETRQPGDIVVSLSAVADGLGRERRAVADLLRQDNAVTQESLGFGLADVDKSAASNADSSDSETDLSAWTVRLQSTFSALIRGLGPRRIEHRDCAFVLDDASEAMIALVGRIATTGGGNVLYREAETVEHRASALVDVASAIAARVPAADVFLHDGSAIAALAIPVAAALVAAVLHGRNPILVTTEDLLDAAGVDTDTPDDGDELRLEQSKCRRFVGDGARLIALLPHASITVLVPIPHDAVLASRAAACFATAIGPFRRDRSEAIVALQIGSGGRLSAPLAGQLVDLWDGRSELANGGLHVASRIVAGPDAHETELANDEAIWSDMKRAYSATVEALMTGIAPHVWRPTRLQPKKPGAPTFHRDLFVSEPTADLLFTPHLRSEPSLRILLTGVPGTGKSTVAEHVARNVLGLATIDLKASDVLFHRLGQLERAIAAAFREARAQNAVLIIDEADSLAQDRYSASPGAAHLVTATTNQILVELDAHTLPVILATNFGERLDAAVKRRIDLTFEVKPIPERLERRALGLILGIEAPPSFNGFGGETTISDYANAKRVARLQGGGAGVAIEAVRRARDVRLGRSRGLNKRIGF